MRRWSTVLRISLFSKWDIVGGKMFFFALFKWEFHEHCAVKMSNLERINWQQFYVEILWQVIFSFRISWRTFWLTVGVVILKLAVSSPTLVPKMFGVSDLCLQLRMYCDVLLHLYVLIFQKDHWHISFMNICRMDNMIRGLTHKIRKKPSVFEVGKKNDLM